MLFLGLRKNLLKMARFRSGSSARLVLNEHFRCFEPVLLFQRLDVAAEHLPYCSFSNANFISHVDERVLHAPVLDVTDKPICHPVRVVHVGKVTHPGAATEGAPVSLALDAQDNALWSVRDVEEELSAWGLAERVYLLSDLSALGAMSRESIRIDVNADVAVNLFDAESRVAGEA